MQHVCNRGKAKRKEVEEGELGATVGEGGRRGEGKEQARKKQIDAQKKEEREIPDSYVMQCCSDNVMNATAIQTHFPIFTEYNMRRIKS